MFEVTITSKKYISFQRNKISHLKVQLQIYIYVSLINVPLGKDMESLSKLNVIMLNLYSIFYNVNAKWQTLH